MADRQRHGVHAEVMAELVGENAGELVFGQLLDGERRDHHEMAAAGEGVDLVERHDAEHVALRREVVHLGEAAPQRVDHAKLAPRRLAGAEQWGEHERLDRADEQQHGGNAIPESEQPERDVPDEADQQPHEEQGEHAERQDDQRRTERRDRRRFDLPGRPPLGARRHHGEATGCGGGVNLADRCETRRP